MNDSNNLDTMSKNGQKLKLALIFGGKSAEHEVSVISAKNVFEAIDRSKYDVFLVGIDKKGGWRAVDRRSLSSGKMKFVDEDDKVFPSVTPMISKGQFMIVTARGRKKIDVAFPIMHGTFGEDGTMQGLLKMFNVPFVGPDVLGSAIGMDKDVSKRLLREAKMPVSKFLVFGNSQRNEITFHKVKKELGLPIFVKPANLGSSVGISKVNDEKGFSRAINEAFSYDKKIIIEEAVIGKEIECSVLGNENPVASIPGEIIPNHDFYSYEAKYIDANGAAMKIPADIKKATAAKIQKMAIDVFKTLCAEGMGRVDFFLTPKDEIFVNEINTIPGFTSISMYPKLWEKSGIAYGELIDKLITLAIKRHQAEKVLRTSK